MTKIRPETLEHSRDINMSAFMVTFTHDFATMWEMEAHIRRGFEQTMPLQDKMAELRLTGVDHGILCGQKGQTQTQDDYAFQER